MVTQLIFTVLLAFVAGALIAAFIACAVLAWRIFSAPAGAFEDVASMSGGLFDTMRGNLEVKEEHRALSTSSALSYDLVKGNWVDEGRLSDEAVDAIHAR